MNLVGKTYGKGRVRVLRLDRGGGGDRHEVRELTVQAMVEGDFGRAFTEADNSTSLCTDTVKNVVNIVARENLSAGNEAFCAAVADRLIERYAPVETATVTAFETKWTRLAFGGEPHPHGFVMDPNGRPVAKVAAARGGGRTTESGISGFTFMKTTRSGWANYIKEPYTTLAETDDRIAATAMEARWLWNAAPADYAAANKTILDTMIEVFATTYSHSVQDSLWRMANAAMEKVPEVERVSLACPNKHYLPMDLSRFGFDDRNQVFLPTDEPHGQIECVVSRE